MHEKRNFIMVLLLVASIVWAVVAWVFLQENAVLHLPQKVGSLLLTVALGAWLFYSFTFEDKLTDHLQQVAGQYYYDADGLSFMPLIRVRDGQAELCVYYQNRFENPVEAVVHLHPPEDSFIIKPGMRDVHFAFKASGGDYGALHQPIAVPRHLQGEVIEIKMAAASWYPRSHGGRLRKKAGLPCGSLLVDWGGNPLKIGVHEVSDEIPLNNPVKLHLAMPENVSEDIVHADVWRQEQIASGAVMA